jgi:syntaxin 1B/2/3
MERSVAASSIPATAAASSSSASSAALKDYPSLAPLARYDAFHASLAEVSGALDEVRSLTAAHSRAATRDARARATARVEDLGASVVAPGLKRAKTILDSIAKEDAAVSRSASACALEVQGGDSAAAKIRANMQSLALGKYRAMVQRAREATESFESQLRARTERDLSVVNPDLSAGQVHALVESGEASEYVRAQLLSDAESAARIEATLGDIEARQLGILALERQVRHLAELFRDLDTLVDLQQESIDVIERHISETKKNTEKGEVQVQQAYHWQTKANKVRLF